MRALFMGMSGQFSAIVLERLLASDIEVSAVLLSGPKGGSLRPLPPLQESEGPLSGEGLELPVLNLPGDTGRHGEALPASLLSLATREGVPVFECGAVGQAEMSDWLAGLSLDVVCVACWNRQIPEHLLGIPRHGFMNVHPSLLPAYRGPYPIFWQYRAGELATGVTVHWMDAGLDTGDIAGQRKIRFEDGLRGAEAEAQCAFAGGDLLEEVLFDLARGNAMRRPQPAGGSYFPSPLQGDFDLDADWHPRRAFNFMRANAEWGIPFRFDGKGEALWLSDALEWRESVSLGPPGEGRIWAAFRGGWVLAEECVGVGL